MKIVVPAVVKPTVPIVAKPSVFNVDSDEDDAEEMPAECKMRMRNIGNLFYEKLRETKTEKLIIIGVATPTSSGPNSFGKTKIGFVDSKKIFEKKLMELAKNLGD
jgi:PEST, proteolytic signal-containing nuclear protein family